jgi:uncharacterized protein (UPF0332 family)
VNQGQAKQISRYWIGKARESVESAQSEFDDGRYGFCVNRLYYASFYSASAYFAARGESYGKHSAVRSSFNRDLVNAGIVPEEYGDLYNALFNMRHESDYTPFAEPQGDDVADKMKKTRDFVELMARLTEETK